MRIAHVVNSFPPYYGGMGNVVFQTVSELARRGHYVEVFTPLFSPEDKQEEEVAQLNEQVSKISRLRPSLRYGNAARLPQLYKRLEDFDIVHLHYPFFGSASLVRKWKLKHPNKPLIITYHMDPRGLGWKGLMFKLYARYYSHRLFNLADKIIASSFDYISSTEAAENFANNPDKWVELPFGVDTHRFKPREKNEVLLRRYNLDPGFPTVLFVGGMDKAHYFKGVSVLLEALLKLKNSGRPVQALLVGDGELRPEFEMGVRAYGLTKYVKFAGHATDEELPYHYNLGDLFVLPSIHKGEAFGMVLLEAFASGVPVVASDLPGVRTVAAEGGIVFEPSNVEELSEAIEGYFANTEAEHLKWCEKVRTLAEQKYDWGPIVDKLENVYNEFVPE